MLVYSPLLIYWGQSYIHECFSVKISILRLSQNFIPVKIFHYTVRSYQIRCLKTVSFLHACLITHVSYEKARIARTMQEFTPTMCENFQILPCPTRVFHRSPHITSICLTVIQFAHFIRGCRDCGGCLYINLKAEEDLLTKIFCNVFNVLYSSPSCAWSVNYAYISMLACKYSNGMFLPYSC